MCWGHLTSWAVSVPSSSLLAHHACRTYLWILVNTAATSYVGDHLFCRMSKHSSPVPYTFGWNMSLMNLTLGGLFGYASSKCMTRRNVPSSKGVSAGPMMTAFLRIVSNSTITALHPSSVPHLHLQKVGKSGGGVSRAGWLWRLDVPCHDIVCYGRCRDTCGRVCLHTLNNLC
jgi:hypothetical protein